MKASTLGTTIRFGVYGLLLGFCLSRIGFSDFSQVHAMFTFEAWRLLLTFGGAVGLLVMVYGLTLKWRSVPKALHTGTVVGGVLFGVGWAITGGCPAVVLVQIGEGRLAALATLAGVVAGTAVYPAVHRRFFPWDSGSCGT